MPLDRAEHEAAWLILDAAHDYLSGRVELAISRTAWRQRNKAAALDLVKVGKTPAQVVKALQTAHEHPVAQERSMHMITNLATLAEKWPTLSGIAQGTVKPFGTLSSSRRDERPRRGIEIR